MYISDIDIAGYADNYTSCIVIYNIVLMFLSNHLNNLPLPYSNDFIITS